MSISEKFHFHFYMLKFTSFNFFITKCDCLYKTCKIHTQVHPGDLNCDANRAKCKKCHTGEVWTSHFLKSYSPYSARWVSIWTVIWTRVDEILTRNIYHRVAKVFTKVEINGTLRHKPLLARQVNIRVYRVYQDGYLPSSSVSKLYHWPPKLSSCYAFSVMTLAWHALQNQNPAPKCWNASKNGTDVPT